VFCCFFFGVSALRLRGMNRENDQEPSKAFLRPECSGLTPQQSTFAYLVGRDGLSLTQAAEQAGFANAGNYGSALMRNPHVRAAVHQIRQGAIEGDLASLALSTMRSLMRDDLTPAPVRFQAAKWTLETCGHRAAAEAAGAPAPEKSLSDMSLQELEAFIARGESALDRLKVVGAPVVEVQAVPAGHSAPHSTQLPSLP
jgi:hypothetical protein